MSEFAINAWDAYEDKSTALGSPEKARDIDTLVDRVFGKRALWTRHENRWSVWYEISIGGEYVADIFPN